MLAPDGTGMGPFSLTPQQLLERELDGGIILMGRPAYKEWLWSLKAGWRTDIPVKMADSDEELAAELSNDNAFDEVLPEPLDGHSYDSDEPVATSKEASATPMGTALPYASLMGVTAQSPPSPPSSSPALSKNDPVQLLPALERIPAQPPICFVDFVNRCGWRSYATNIAGFWRRKEKVRQGGEAAIRLLYGDKSSAREFEAPEGADRRECPPQGGDLDWGLEGERKYPPYFLKTLRDVEKARENYYKALPERLLAARQIASGEREMTKAEIRDPPPTESDLRVERFEKERDWRRLEMGYDILRPDASATWDEGFRGSLRVFSEDVDPSIPETKL